MGMRHAVMACFNFSLSMFLCLVPLCGVEAETNRKYMSIMEAGQSAAARRHYGKGIDAFNAARWEEAMGHFKDAAAEHSFYQAGALYNIALLKDASGDEEEAHALLLEAIKLGSPVSRPGGPAQYIGGGVEFAIYPMQGPCRARLGLMHARSGDFETALEMFDGALAVDPDDITSRRNGIVALHKLGRTAEASARYESLLADDPNYAQPLLEQTQVMMQPGDPGLPGTGRMERWMECDVQANSESQLSDFELSSCRLQDGERFLVDGVLAEPTDPNAWYQLGAFYRQHDMVWDCVRAMTHALRLNGRYAQALAVMGGTLADNTNYTLSIPPLERALQLHPGDLYARANIVLSNAWTCQWARNRHHIRQFIQQLQGGLDTDLKAFPAPAHMLFIVGGYCEAGPEEEEAGQQGAAVGLPLLTYRRWVDMWAEEQAARIDGNMFRTRYPGHPGDNLLRIGWVSGAGFQKSPGSSAIRGVFALHDRQRFRVHCFALKPDLRANDLRSNVSGSCDVFHELGNIPNDKTLAEAVNAHQPHLIIDVSGFSGDHRIKFLAHRPAPLSMTFCEYPGTLGKGTGMDLIITDRVASPPEYQLIYSEKMLSLPAPYLPNDYVATVAEPELARKPLPPLADQPLFCALHHVWKMDETVFSIWMEVLRQVPHSRLRLQECSAEAKATLCSIAKSHGVEDCARLVFNPKIGDYYQHINKLGSCRLFFDAPKYNAHTSAGDAIWAGVPVITAPHEMMVHRGAACLLAATDVTVTIARNIEEYRALALRLAVSTRSLEQTRSLFQATRETANMFNTPRWTRALERGARISWEALLWTHRAMHSIPRSEL